MNRSSCTWALFTISLVVAAAPPAKASPLLFTVGTSAAIQDCIPTSPPPATPPPCTVLAFSSTGQAISYVNPALGNTFDEMNLNAAAQATFGGLHAAETMSFLISEFNNTALAETTASFFDQWTINSATENGQQGFLTLSFILNGRVVPDVAGSTAVASAFIGICHLGSVCQTQNESTFLKQYNSQVTLSDQLITTSPLPFIYGQPFGFQATMDALVETSRALQGNGGGIVDFGDTFSIAGLTLTDANGNAVTDGTMNTGSGVTYPIETVTPVPEPASLVLLGTGFVATLSRSRFRRRTPNTLQ